MSKIKNPLDLYKHLDKSNCRRCHFPSCMAFAVAVIQGNKKLTDCPTLAKEKITELSGEIVQRKSLESEQDKILTDLRKRLANKNLADIARKQELPFQDEMVGVNCLGKYFWIDATGDMISECHKNMWVQLPVLYYLLNSKGVEPVGRWIAFNAAKDAGEWSQFFSHRCENEMRRLADTHTDLFFEILDMFGTKTDKDVNDADYTFILHPLPNTPFLINYWKPEESFGSKLNILFDETVTDHINVQSIYSLGRGLVEMFGQFIVKHNRDGKLF